LPETSTYSISLHFYRSMLRSTERGIATVSRLAVRPSVCPWRWGTMIV